MRKFFILTMPDYQQKLKESQERFDALERDLQNPEIMLAPEKIKTLSRDYNEVKETLGHLLRLKKISGEIAALEKTLKEELEPELKKMTEEEIKKLTAEKTALENHLDEIFNPASPLDKKNIIMEIRAGTGGDESALFSANLFRMYSRFAEKKGWAVKIISQNRTPLGGCKEIIFEINGQNAYRQLKYESGVHRVQRIPETEKAGRVHTSAATVAVGQHHLFGGPHHPFAHRFSGAMPGRAQPAAE